MGQAVEMGALGDSKGRARRLDTPVVAIAPRISKCPACDTPNPSTNKFCRECGERLNMAVGHFASYAPSRSGATLRVDGGSAGSERRMATVLFTDVSGFTAMSERLDPEDVFEIMDRAFAIILDAVHGHDGTINQFLGDGVMALFESGEGVEDHAARALVAARAIQESLKPLADEVRRTHDVEFRMRIGIHTGPIVVGAIGDLRGDYTALGRTTQVAARLLSVARPGEIVISGDTRRRLAGRSFSFEDLGDFAADSAGGFTRGYAVIGNSAEDFVGAARRAWAVPEVLSA